MTNKSIRRKSIKSLIPYLLLLGILATSLLSLVGNVGWHVFLQLLSHFKLQYFFISLLLFSFLAITRKKQLILIGLFCVVINLTEIVYWSIPALGLRDSGAGELRVLSSNVNVRNNNYSKVISLVREERPDIAIFMEVIEAWIKQQR